MRVCVRPNSECALPIARGRSKTDLDPSAPIGRFRTGSESLNSWLMICLFKPSRNKRETYNARSV